MAHATAAVIATDDRRRPATSTRPSTRWPAPAAATDDDASVPS